MHIFFLVFLISNFLFSPVWANNGIYLNYDDLVELSKTASPEGSLKEKLNKQLNSVIIQQAEENIGFLHDDKWGDFFRLASWNIERGFNVDFISQVFKKNIPDLDKNEFLRDEVDILSKSGIVILNEVDIGIPRTKYENIAEKLAKNLKMGYVYGTEFVEVDPYQLGVKKFSKEERSYLEEEALKELDNIDKTKYHGLHGTAILSAYPIVSAKVIRIPNCYDWYKSEDAKLAPVERFRRTAASTVFAEKVLSELRHGSRMALVADIKLPNNKTISVVACHIENRCLPAARLIQVKYLFDQIKNTKNPVIVAGDFNTTGADASPTSIKKEVGKRVKDPQFIARQAVFFLAPYGLIPKLVVTGLNSVHQYKDPTAKNIPIIFPNKERKLFDYISDFKFADGNAFDIRGGSNRAYSGHGLLGNSNERSLKGFKQTFEMARAFGLAKYKLDWFFIKPLNLTSSNDEKGSYAYAPFNGRTLGSINKSFGEKISDHDPITVDVTINN